MTREEIQAELDRQVADSMMTVTVSPRAFVHEEGWVELALANDARNKVQQRFTLVQEGKAVYESGIVAPGRELSSFEVKGPVSYTHLDVYKRQCLIRNGLVEGSRWVRARLPLASRWVRARFLRGCRVARA